MDANTLFLIFLLLFSCNFHFWILDVGYNPVVKTIAPYDFSVNNKYYFFVFDQVIGNIALTAYYFYVYDSSLCHLYFSKTSSILKKVLKV